ncbi:hypothetical protein Dimus_010922 [Dionaea muscipula]
MTTCLSPTIATSAGSSPSPSLTRRLAITTTAQPPPCHAIAAQSTTARGEEVTTAADAYTSNRRGRAEPPRRIAEKRSTPVGETWGSPALFRRTPRSRTARPPLTTCSPSRPLADDPSRLYHGTAPTTIAEITKPPGDQCHHPSFADTDHREVADPFVLQVMNDIM